MSALKQAKREVIIYPYSYHDLLLDIDKDIVIKDIIDYLDDQI
jgi:esterase/lipase